MVRSAHPPARALLQQQNPAGLPARRFVVVLLPQPGIIYESDITKGPNVSRLRDRIIEGAMNLPHLNPPTQEFSLP